jgi:lysozyme
MNTILTLTKSWIATGLLLFTLSCGQSSQQSSPGTVSAEADSSSQPVSEATGKQINANLNTAVLGIDVSHFQNDVNWDEVKKANIQYMYTKATQGEDGVDPKYKRNRAGAVTAGLYHGAYHFYMADDDPVKQADLFIKTVKPLNDHSIPPVLDLEQGGMTSNIKTTVYQQNVLTWLSHVEAELGVRPIIYTDHPFGNQYLNHPEFAKYQLWIAEYGSPEPRIPNAWKDKGWIMWQRSERGKIEGAIGNVDHDLFNGTDAGLDELVVD